MAWQQKALAPVAFWIVFTIGRRFVGQWLLNARRGAPAEEQEAPATASAPKDAKNAKEATVNAPKNKKKKQKPPEAPKSAKRHDPRGGLAVCGVMVALAAAAFSVRLGYVSSIVLLLGTARSPPNWNIECFELC